MIVRRLTDSDALAQESVASSAFIYAFDPEKLKNWNTIICWAL